MVRFWSCTTSKSALPDSTRLLSAWTSPSSSATGGRREALPWTLSNRNLGEGREGLILQQQPAVGRDPREPSVRPQGMHKILRYTVSILSWVFAPPSVLFLPIFFPLFFSKYSGLEQVLPCGHDPNAGDRNVLTPLCVHPGQRRWGEPNRGGCQWNDCPHQQLSTRPPNPEPRAAVPASTDCQGTL